MSFPNTLDRNVGDPSIINVPQEGSTDLYKSHTVLQGPLVRKGDAADES